jgi:hypothetical protein
MSNLNFLNTDNCNDVGVDTPIQDLTFVDYILKNKVKDFTNVRKYTVTYSINCKDEVTVDVPPNYQFKIVSVSCDNDVNLNSYTIRLEGIHGDLVNQILYSTIPPLAGFGIGWTNTNGVITITLLYDDSLDPLPDCQFTVIHIDGFEYVITFTLNQSPPDVCSWDGTVAGFSINYDLPLNIGQPTYGGKFATTGIIGLQIGPEIVVEIVADNVGTAGNISIVTDGISNLDFWVNDWNINNPTNTVTLTYIEGANWIGAGETFTLSGGVNPTIPDNLQLSLNTLYALSVLYPASYEVKICETTIIPSGRTFISGGNFQTNPFIPEVTDICIKNNQFIDCQTAKCIDSNLCDSTEDICNLTVEIKKQYQSIIYGIDCCGEAKQKILKHYIRIVCPDELNC